ncbi:hypothetical protein [Sphingomonas sp.]|uniref:hypothetical protein n=1 Tax=Sphingomonas sp. TaxID=28214 RepID=UPI002E3698B3|nr:hypothetical protein [Sphingomonas sp.]HEX4694477.1 hypothetical protein [Sphingomonas sp.]
MTFAALEQEFGVAHMAPYLAAAGGLQARAVRLHTWNSNVGAAFHRPLGILEVAIRSRADLALTTVFGPHWWQDQDFLDQATVVTRRAVADAVAHAQARGRVAHDDVVAEITFGTWVAILRPRFFDLVWRAHQRTMFPNRWGMKFASVATTADGLLRLRNAIVHYEPLLAMNLADLHQDLLDMLGWMSHQLAAQVHAVSFVPKVLADRP